MSAFMHMHDGAQVIYTDKCPVCTRDEEIAELKEQHADSPVQ